MRGLHLILLVIVLVSVGCASPEEIDPLRVDLPDEEVSRWEITVQSTYWRDGRTPRDPGLGIVRGLTEDGRTKFLVTRSEMINLFIEGDQLIAICDPYDVDCTFFFND